MNGLLLDSHVLLWWADNPGLLSAESRAQIEDSKRDVFISVASAWEIGIKKASGKLRAPEDLPGLLRSCGFQALTITLAHAEESVRLPLHHRDPFDRMLVAQARCEKLILVTADRELMCYGIDILVA